MTHDTVVVGAGLAGLTAALRVADEGRRVAVVATGVGATHLSSGTIDVLGWAPELVERPADALAQLVAARPDHPYARVGVEAVADSVEWLKERLGDCRYAGGLGENVLLATPAGAVKPSAVVPESMAAGDLRAGGAFVFVGLRGLRDFYPRYLAANLPRAARSAGIELAARPVELALQADASGDNAALALARSLEWQDVRNALVDELLPLLRPEERVGFPAVLGLTEAAGIRRELERRLGRPVFELPTLPPSVPGIRLFEALTRALRAAGGRLVIGAPVVGVETRRRRVEAVLVEAAARRVPYRADSFVLATGGFAARGIELDSFGEVRETVFGLPVAGVPAAGERRFGKHYLDHHPIAAAGVAVDEQLRPVDADGAPVYDNLYAAGATLAGAVPWREGSGNGISLATGFAAAGAILAGSGVLEAVS